MNIAFSAATLIRTEKEKPIVFETIKTISSYGFPIIIVDGGSSPENQKIIRDYNNVYFFEQKGNLTKQLLLAHTKAAEHADYIFYLQSDKLGFAKDVIPSMLTKYDSLEKKGVLIPSRTPESLNTYPFFQKNQEAFLNFFMSDYIGIIQDYFAGPKIFPKQLVGYTPAIQQDIGWGIESFYYVLAKRLEIPFDFFSCFISAPLDVDEEKKTKHYRLLGTKWQIDGFLLAQQIPL